MRYTATSKEICRILFYDVRFKKAFRRARHFSYLYGAKSENYLRRGIVSGYTGILKVRIPNQLKDEQEWQDRIEQQEHEDCNQDTSINGLCPCCGVELERHSHEMCVGEELDDTVEELQDICPSCGWTSVFMYDA